MTTLAGRTILISGGSRGIGLAIATRAARDGANIALVAKTDRPDPRLAGTIHTAARALAGAGGRADGGAVRRHRRRRQQRERPQPQPLGRPRPEALRPHAGRQRAWDVHAD